MQSFIIKYVVSGIFLVDALYHIEEIPFYLYSECFYYEKDLGFAQYFFVIYWDDYMGTVLYYLDMLYYIDFLDVKAILHSWD